jgi:UTP--glucose-1-phosphate uridylyltransferase
VGSNPTSSAIRLPVTTVGVQNVAYVSVGPNSRGDGGSPFPSPRLCCPRDLAPTVPGKTINLARGGSIVKVRKAVIPAAGLGTRLLPASKAVPKEMLPVVDKPVIQYIVEEAVASGITDIILVTGYGKQAIENHFDTSFELEFHLDNRGKKETLEQVRRIDDMANIIYVRQKEPLGNGHAVLVAKAAVGDEPFAVLWGDDIILGKPPVTRQMIDAFERLGGPIIAVQQKEAKDWSRYGMVAVEQVRDREYRVHDVVEKPEIGESPSNLAQIGGFILTPDIFDILGNIREGTKGEIYLADALRMLVQERPVYAYEFDGIRYDTGDKLDYLKAIVELALGREEFGEEFREYLVGLIS